MGGRCWRIVTPPPPIAGRWLDPSVSVPAFTASVDPHHTHQRVLVGCPDGVDRQRTQVRAVIGSTGRADVRFVDER